jgi:hypothetical protein
MTPTPLEIVTYLTDSTFMSIVALTVSVFIALEFINKIGGAK